MATYSNGSSGAAVVRIQEALKTAGLLHGEPDGNFGRLTEVAVKNFQASCGLTVDGTVGDATWSRLFPAGSASVVAGADDLASRSLALTGSFETGCLAPDCFAGIAGDFDGQGLSFGALQWNFGQGTLQPMVKEMLTAHPEVATAIFGANLNQLQQAVSGGKEAALAFAASIQDPAKKTIYAPWKQMFRNLGLSSEFQTIEVKGAAAYYGRAVQLCSLYGLWSERGRALMFDISVQNGSIGDSVRALIMADFEKMPPALSPEDAELQKMRIVANRRAEAANPKFVEDVRRRKLCIAEGKGNVHGIAYDLEAQFGLGLRRAAAT